MNFKIENSYLSITNYPSMERHLEDMASKGWLIKRIIFGSIFIYKKVQPTRLDFSISPYEIETAYTRKSKDELDEFTSVCESVGWNYATKSDDLHIYFKEHGSEALDIQTDEEEEFRTLELIGKKQIKGYYFIIPLFLFIAWVNFGDITTSINFMKDGLAQILVPLIPIGILLMVADLFQTKSFLKINKRNIELGKSIEYNDSKFHFHKIAFSITKIFLLLFIIYIFYLIIVLKNKFVLIGTIPTLIGATVGAIYRFYIKPSKIKLKYKKIGLIVTLVATSLMIILIFGISIINIVNKENYGENFATDSYKVLVINDFGDITLVDNGELIRQASLLIPRSYEYDSYAGRQGYIRTEYSQALTENLAINLVNRYKKQAENTLIGGYNKRYVKEFEYYFEQGNYDTYLLRAGLTMEDFNSLKEKDLKEAIKASKEIIKERSIVEDKEKLWNLDEVYFLNYDKMEIVIRDGKEVFYLEGQDFSDIEIIKIVKEKLNLD